MCSIIKKSHTLLNSTMIRNQGGWSKYCSNPFNEGLMQNILTAITIYDKKVWKEVFLMTIDAFILTDNDSHIKILSPKSVAYFKKYLKIIKQNTIFLCGKPRPGQSGFLDA